MFNPIDASKIIKEEFIGYITTYFNIADRDYAKQFEEALQTEGAIARGPYLELGDAYRTGRSLAQMMDAGEASTLFRELEGDMPDREKELQIDRALYLHQEQALQKTNQGNNIIVTTGTGSGKTECFVIPIINHLLREKEKGTLDAGVRAILIYPMNALANDQMKRLRSLLKNSPEITFGVYNGSTAQTEEGGLREYEKIYSMKPLPNEYLSRDQMQKTPPHILVTNYAMLEYMMLRPKDDLVFSRAKLRFLVLDEAHIYRGATGMETSLLLKRLKARISDSANVLHILTSATLGGKDADADIVKFANTLCNAEFRSEDIVRSVSQPPSFEGTPVNFPLSLFDDLAHPQKPLNIIAGEYGLSIPESQKDAEFLYDLCLRASVYRELRQIVQQPMTLPEIESALGKSFDVKLQNIVNIIRVASQAEKNKTALVKARYHMFVRALEGAFITIGKHKKLMLNRCRMTPIDGEDWHVFECAVCDDCGRIAVAIPPKADENNTATGTSLHNAKEMDYYLLWEKGALDSGSDDEILEGGAGQVEKDDFLLCPKCGKLLAEGRNTALVCDCGESYVRVRKARKTEVLRDAKCPSCGAGTFKLLYLGYDAATAVLATSLFEVLPETESVLKSEAPQDHEDEDDNPFLAVKKKTTQATVRSKKGRQFLSFSDSRGEAAFFASYMTKSYQEFQRRRGIWHIVEENKTDLAKNPWEIKDFVRALENYFNERRIFAKPEDVGNENLTIVSREQAWVAVLNEMVNARRSTSLVSLGIIKFNYKGNTKEFMHAVADKYQQRDADARALFDLLVMDIVYYGALKGDCDLNDEEKEYIFYTHLPKYVKALKEGSSDNDDDTGKKATYSMSWCAASGKNGKLQINGRVRRVMNVLGVNEAEANKLLKYYWSSVLCQGDAPLTQTDLGEWYFGTQCFTISAGDDTHSPIFRCTRCGKTSMVNCHGKCPTVKCGGDLVPVSHEELLEHNHYARLYQSSLMTPFHIKEHTAQLGRDAQQKYQEMFLQKKINALSCSTTFEMGVDVGDLETVYLRDMPPSPANYVQRAGRVGRGKHTAAFSLTYAKLSSHDFTYFNRPENMITGKNGVPLFAVENEKIILRHIFAVALSAFFAKMPDVYNRNDADVFLNGDGWERLCDYLRQRPADLHSLLLKSIPKTMHTRVGLNDDSWIEKLIGSDGILTVAVEDFRNTVKFYQDECDHCEPRDFRRFEYRLQNYRRSHDPDDKCGKNDFIDFLVRNNVLPKYGFPVDTVELYPNSNSDFDKSNKNVQLIRDLQLAISEYAPGAQVVADDKLYTSRFIRKSPGKNGTSWENVWLAQCEDQSCKTWNYRNVEINSDEERCVSCRKPIPKSKWRKAIEPRKGFVAERNPKDVPMRKPDKIYRSDDAYIGDTNRQVTHTYVFETADQKLLKMETSMNDSLMVVCNDDFYVCPKCGYAESVMENKEKSGSKKFNSHKKKLEIDSHPTPWGKLCQGRELEKNKLCHVFKTDVVRLEFHTPQARERDVMLSVLYALLEAMSSVLDIERNDIKGCLHTVVLKDARTKTQSIVLYDAVAGGAGHVRRLVTEDGDTFRQVVEKAIEITSKCDCSPSCYRCLRNYYNQKIHDRLDREKAAEFLREWSGQLVRKAPNNDNATSTEKTAIAIAEDPGIDMQAEEWIDIWDRLLSSAETDAEHNLLVALKDNSCLFEGKEKPYYGCEFKTDDEYECDLLWIKSKTMFFLAENRSGYDAARQSAWNCFLADDESLKPNEIAETIKGE